MVPADACFRFRLPGVNAYLVDDDEVWTLVDAGMPWHDGRIRDGLARVGLTPSDVDRVLVTHYDLDHVGALATVAADVPVHVADPDAAFLEGSRRPPVFNHKGALQRVLGLFSDRPDLSVNRLHDGDSVGGFTAYRTPGHTPGHTSFVHREYGLGFLGDVATSDGDGLAASPRVICYDGAQNAASIRSLADRVAPFEVACVGHGAPVAGGRRALRRLADRLQ
jgi:glyoxylase-like metal-dependent hydrolase (beta-lactamase superfamily II)